MSRPNPFVLMHRDLAGWLVACTPIIQEHNGTKLSADVLNVVLGAVTRELLRFNLDRDWRLTLDDVGDRMYELTLHPTSVCAREYGEALLASGINTYIPDELPHNLRSE